jgi:hypothetical protein
MVALASQPASQAGRARSRWTEDLPASQPGRRVAQPAHLLTLELRKEGQRSERSGRETGRGKQILITPDLTYLAKTIEQDKAGIEPMPGVVRERLALIHSISGRYNAAQTQSELDEIRKEVWQSAILSHFDKMALEAVYNVMGRALFALAKVKENS